MDLCVSENMKYYFEDDEAPNPPMIDKCSILLHSDSLEWSL